MNISVGDLLDIFFKNLGTIATAAIVALIASVLICVFAPVSYKSSAMILVKPGQYIESDATTTAAFFARQEQKINSLVEVLRSPEVVSRALDRFGANRLFPQLGSDNGNLPQFALKMRETVDGWKLGNSLSVLIGRRPPRDEALLLATKAISVSAQPRTDLISVSVTNKDAKVAAGFANTLLDTFRLRTMELYSRSGADEFFTGERKKYDEAFEISSDRLSAFAIANNAYSIDEQRKLTLERRNELQAAAVRTRSSIVEKQNQASATAAQIANLKPIAQYPQVRDLTQSIPKKTPKDNGSPLPEIATSASTPPLLLVKVYQETVQSLVQLKSDIAGLDALKAHQQDELTKVDAELQKLAEDEAKFDRLKLEVDQAKAASQQYSTLAAKERMAAEVNEKGLSTIEVAQPAIAPVRPSFPNPYIILPVGGAAGLLLGFCIPLLRLMRERIREDSGEEKVRQFETIPWGVTTTLAKEAKNAAPEPFAHRRMTGS